MVGIGVAPNTEWLAGSGLALEDGVVCDETAATGAPGIVAVGDAVNDLPMLEVAGLSVGFSPKPEPVLIATHKVHGEALTISKGLDRDRAVGAALHAGHAGRRADMSAHGRGVCGCSNRSGA